MAPLQFLMFRLWESACADRPSRPSCLVSEGRFHLTINGNRDNWIAMAQAAGVPSDAAQTSIGNILTLSWPSYADALFAPDGPIAHQMPGFEARAGQLHMARLFQRAVEMGAPAVVEAGTGIGKSFAYAAVAMAMGKRLLISTSNKALQMQLMQKDLPFLQRIFPDKRIAVAIGKSNYLCRLKAEDPMSGVCRLPAGALRDWALATDSGNLEELPAGPRADGAGISWQEVDGVRLDDECIGRHCPLFDGCFYYNARSEMEQADVIVTNHTLLCLNLAHDGALLPDMADGVLVIDEAHKLADAARSAWGVELTHRQIERAVKLAERYADAGPVATCRAQLDRFALETARWASAKAATGSREPQIPLPADLQFESARDLATALGRLADHIWLTDWVPANADDKRRERRAAALRTLAGRVRTVGATPLAETVRWMEPERENRPLTLCAQPIDVSDVLGAMTLMQPTLYCSATLAAPDLAPFLSQIGRDDALQLVAASPFDYADAALLYAPGGTAPAPGEQAHPDWLLDQLRSLVYASQGGAFLLFTSLRMLREMADRLTPGFERSGFLVLRQGDMPRAEIVRRFREHGSAVLFATKSFFEGVSIDGMALRLVVVDKLPFEAPSPLTTAMEAHAQVYAVESLGLRGPAADRYPFNAVRLPRMVVELKQALGRLIRTQDDRGVMAVLDARLRSAQYGRNSVLPALPPARLTAQLAHVQGFFHELRYPAPAAASTAAPAHTRPAPVEVEQAELPF